MISTLYIPSLWYYLSCNNLTVEWVYFRLLRVAESAAFNSCPELQTGFGRTKWYRKDIVGEKEKAAKTLKEILVAIRVTSFSFKILLEWIVERWLLLYVLLPTWNLNLFQSCHPRCVSNWRISSNFRWNLMHLLHLKNLFHVRFFSRS